MKKSIFKKFVSLTAAASMMMSMAVMANAAGEDKNLALGSNGATAFVEGGTAKGGAAKLNNGVLSAADDSEAAYIDAKEGSDNTLYQTYPAEFGIQFANPTKLNKIVVYARQTDTQSRVTEATIQYLDGQEWKNVETSDILNTTVATDPEYGTVKLYISEFKFTDVESTKFRLHVTGGKGAQVAEIEAYYITNPNFTANTVNVGGFANESEATDTATGFLATVTNDGNAEGTFNSMDITVRPSAGESKTFEKQTATATLAVGAKAYFGIIANNLNDKGAVATVTVK